MKILKVLCGTIPLLFSPLAHAVDRAGALDLSALCSTVLLAQNFSPPNPLEVAQDRAQLAEERSRLALPLLSGYNGYTDGFPNALMRLFYRREILFHQLEQVETRLASLERQWNSAVSRQLSTELEAAKAAGTVEAFINEYRPLVNEALAASHPTFDKKGIESQTRILLDALRRRYIPVTAAETKKIQTALVSHGQPVWTLFDSACGAGGLHYFDPDTPLHYHQASDHSSAYINMITEMRRSFPLKYAFITPDLAPLLSLQPSDIVDPVVFSPTSQTFELVLPRKRVMVRFNRDLSLLEMMPIDGRISLPGSPVLALAHGATTWASNVASWTDMIPVFENAGFNPNAIDLESAMGYLATSAEARKPAATAAVINEWLHDLRKQTNNTQPIVAVGRSFGSTQHFTAALATHWFGVKEDREGADALILTSFSNPEKLQEGFERIHSLMLRQHGDPMRGLIPESIAHLTAFAEQLNNVMAGVSSISPSSINHFGDEILFVQGEADADGGPNAVQDLMDFRNRRAPKAHIYVIPDPWGTLSQSSELDPDNREASHFLLTSRGNITKRNRGNSFPGIPDENLPQLGDQNIEIQALTWAFLDYRADMSEFTSETSKARIAAGRHTLTGGNERYGYFKWYLQKLINEGHALPPYEVLSSDATKAGRKTLTERLKRVWTFIEHLRQQST